MGRSKNEKLFAAEFEVVARAEAAAAAPKHGDNPLLNEYRGLLNEYKKLLRQSRKVFYISDSQGYLVKKHQTELQTLLDNANQGFLTFGGDLLVNRQYSAECARIFGQNIAGLPITGLLSQGDTLQETRLQEQWQRFFTASREEAAECLPLPARFRVGECDVLIECKMIESPEEDKSSLLVMMILTDVSAQTKAAEQIHFLSYHDSLTALHNRAYVDMLLPAIRQENNLPLSLILADMNGLKLVNDVFGHLQGDALLCQMAAVLRQIGRPDDILVRWGGDEFLLILPRTGPEECLELCEQIHRRCADVKGEVMPLSAALGTATQTESRREFNALFALAESQMYKDKLLNSRAFRQLALKNFQTILNGVCCEKTEHVQRAAELAVQFAEHLDKNLTDVDRRVLQRLAELHDIGKVSTLPTLLGKTDTLMPDEWNTVQKHSESGYRLVQSIGEPEIAELILSLHEHWNGTGYPYRLKGEAIPYFSRLFAIVDAYDVMTHDQPYRQALSPQQALKEIRDARGSQFDPNLAERFCDFGCSWHKNNRG